MSQSGQGNLKQQVSVKRYEQSFLCYKDGGDYEDSIEPLIIDRPDATSEEGQGRAERGCGRSTG